MLAAPLNLYFLACGSVSFRVLGAWPCPPVGWVPPAGSFLSRQEAPQESGSREALTAASSRRRAALP